MPKIWKLKPEILQEVNQKLSEYPKLLRQLLFNRGLVEKSEVDRFLNPKYEDLYSPFLFGDMQKAVDRIWQAIEQNQPITIYGDYDADAVTANAVLQQTFRYLGVKVSSYIPDRFTEGYGINIEALEKIKSSGAKLIITVDCGTNSTDAAEFCAANNIDLIITDHHEVIGGLPKAFAVINPKNRQDKYPFEDITGVGVAFKLACGILERVQGTGSRVQPQPSTLNPIKGWEKWLLDLVAIGTVADCHSLLGENRVLVKYGLKVLQKTKWTGLKALIASSALDFTKTPPDSYALGFVIAPRLNAAGRLEHGDVALDLLLETDLQSATKKAANLEQINRRRQEQTARIVSEAKGQALLLGERKIIVIAGEGWNKGVVGLVAGKLAEEFYKPVIVMEKTPDFSTGSARTVGEFDILEAIKFSSEHVIRFGGHKQAAGLTVETSKLEIFYQKILSFAETNIPAVGSQKTLELEAELDGSDLQHSTFNLITFLEPFGVDNPKPKFLIPCLTVVSTRLVGQQEKHLQIRFSAGSREIDSIIFSAPDFAKNLKIGDTVDVAAELMEDGWNGRKALKLRVVELRAHFNILTF